VERTLQSNAAYFSSQRPPAQIVLQFLGFFSGRDDFRVRSVGQARWIKLSAQPDGTFTVTNSRNGFSKTYRARN
jgi:hypothetical protein